MAFDLIIKIGNQPIEGGHKDGMPVTIQPSGTVYSDNMRKVFAIVTLPDNMLPDVMAALDSDIVDGKLQNPVKGYFNLEELAESLGDSSLVNKWRSSQVVPAQDGTSVDKSLVRASKDVISWPVVEDTNVITSGSTTIGSGGGYSNWAAFQADIGNLTGDLTATQISDTTGEGVASKSIDLGTYTLTITSDTPHQGDPTAGWSSTSTVANQSVVFLNLTGSSTSGTLEIKNVKFYHTTNNGDSLSLSTVAATVSLHDSIVHKIGASGHGCSIVGSGGGSPYNVLIWNCYFTATLYGLNAIINGAPNSFIVENNTSVGGFSCFSLVDNTGSGSCIARNNCGFSSSVDDFNVGGFEGYNNASEDASADDSIWFGGSSGNQINITPANEFESLSTSSSDYLKAKIGGVCDDGGTATGIAGNTSGIRGTPRPGSDTLYSIGADELLSISSPTITLINPSSGEYYGGDSVTITGTEFQAGATVTFDGNSATGINVVSATQIDCTTPAGTAGAVDVVVTNPDTGSVTSVGGFTYIAIVVSSITPNDGPKTGGTPVTIGGTAFNVGVTVTIGGNPATSIVRVSDTQITCVTPAGTGVVDVVAQNPDLQTGTLAGGFSYILRQISVTIPTQIGEGLAGIFRTSPGLSDVMNKISANMAEIKAASQQDNFAEFKLAMEDIEMITIEDRPRYVTPYPASITTISIPDRLGEDYVGINRAQSETLIGLRDILIRIAAILSGLKTASQEADFAAFKVSVAALPSLDKSDDSRI